MNAWRWIYAKNRNGRRTPGPALAEGGFTLSELAVVLAVIALGTVLVLPALARTQPQSRAIQCLNNLRQMQAGAQAYANDFADVMLPNAPISATTGNAGSGWCPGSEDWSASRFNINTEIYRTNGLGHYVANVMVYKCPSDTIPSANGQRIRSYSMNGYMGTYYAQNGSWPLDSRYIPYVKTTDLVGSVPPSMGMVFMEESMNTLNDGYLEMNLSIPLWPDLPGSYHNGAMGVSFADGHTELHQWVTAFTMVPVRYGYRDFNVPTSGTNPDWLWFRAHAAALKP
jgi:prepilin-type processing-associated H-X9-DG protein